jgi:hypothetical protein
MKNRFQNLGVWRRTASATRKAVIALHFKFRTQNPLQSRSAWIFSAYRSHEQSQHLSQIHRHTYSFRWGCGVEAQSIASPSQVPSTIMQCASAIPPFRSWQNPRPPPTTLSFAFISTCWRPSRRCQKH